MTNDAKCHCGRPKMEYMEPTCDGCDRVEFLCRCDPLPEGIELWARYGSRPDNPTRATVRRVADDTVHFSYIGARGRPLEMDAGYFSDASGRDSLSVAEFRERFPIRLRQDD